MARRAAPRKPKTPTTPSTRALVSLDPLTQYLAAVQRYPMLTDTEERDLVARYRATGDVAAARQLVTSHLRLVVKIAMEYRSAYYNVLDLIQEGNVGMVVAVKKYDPDKGARLGYYASWWIRSYILKYILDNFRLIKIGTTKTQRKLFYNLIQEKRKIESLGFRAETKLLAARLGVPAAEIDEMSRRLEQPELALDAPVGHEAKSATFGDFIADNDVPIDEKLAQQELRNTLGDRLEAFAHELSARDRQIFEERLRAEIPRTLQDIADEYGITKERVRQLEARILDKLKAHLQAAGIDRPLD